MGNLKDDGFEEYLGDGVYVKMEEGDVVLGTESVAGRHGQRLYLEPTVWLNLINFVSRKRREIADACARL